MAKRNIVRTDGLDYILDEEILLEKDETKQLGFDDLEEFSGEFVEQDDDSKSDFSNFSINVFALDNKSIRRRYYELLESSVQAYLEDRKRGHDFRKIEQVVEGKATALNYLEAIVYLCAVSAKLRSLSAFVQREESANIREDVNRKIERLEKLESYLLNGIDNYSSLLCGLPTDKAVLRRQARGKDSRETIRRKIKKDFVGNCKVELI